MDLEEKRHFAVALLHKQTPGVPVFPFYAQIDEMDPKALDKFIERLSNELVPRVAPRGGPANLGTPFNRITNNMLGGRRTRKQRRRRRTRHYKKHDTIDGRQLLGRPT